MHNQKSTPCWLPSLPLDIATLHFSYDSGDSYYKISLNLSDALCQNCSPRKKTIPGPRTDCLELPDLKTIGVLLVASNIQKFEVLASCLGPGFGEWVLNPQLAHIVWQHFGSGTILWCTQVYLPSLHHGFGTTYRGIWSHYQFGETCFFSQIVIHIFIVPLNKAQNWWIAMGFSQTTASLLGGPILVETQNSWIKYDELPDFWREKCPTLRLPEHGLPPFQGFSHHISQFKNVKGISFLGTLKYAFAHTFPSIWPPIGDESWLTGAVGNGMIVEIVLRHSAIPY